MQDPAEKRPQAIQSTIEKLFGNLTSKVVHDSGKGGLTPSPLNETLRTSLECVVRIRVYCKYEYT